MTQTGSNPEQGLPGGLPHFKFLLIIISIRSWKGNWKLINNVLGLIIKNTNKPIDHIYPTCSHSKLINHLYFFTFNLFVTFYPQFVHINWPTLIENPCLFPNYSEESFWRFHFAFTPFAHMNIDVSVSESYQKFGFTNFQKLINVNTQWLIITEYFFHSFCRLKFKIL